MAIEAIPGGGVVVTGIEDVNFVRLSVLKGALRLECLGMGRRGRSVYSIVKEEFGFKGSKEKVLAQLEAYIEKAKKERGF